MKEDQIRSTRAWLNWIDDAAQEEIDDMRRYTPKKECYKKALEAAAKTGGVNAVDELGEFILERTRNGLPPDTQWVRRRGCGICRSHDADPSGTYLAR